MFKNETGTVNFLNDCACFIYPKVSKLFIAATCRYGRGSTVHIQHMAVDEIGSVASKERRRTYKFLRGAPTAPLASLR